MKSFPSSLNRGNKNLIMNHASKSLLDTVLSSFKNSFKNSWEAGIKSIKFGAKRTGTNVNVEGLPFDDFIDKKALLSGLDFTRFRNYRGQETLRSSSILETDSSLNIENPYNFDSNAIAIMNKYRGETLSDVITSSNVPSKNGEENRLFGSGDSVKRSLFNPYNGVHVIGMTENIPLLYDQDETQHQALKRDINISDCSISRLVSESSKRDSILGQARYKYADFAFCKDLGMPNNRLITLRKFSIPVGDYISRAATKPPKIQAEGTNDSESAEIGNPFTMPGDIGRMCCYFDTDDNKLEDILKYSFVGSWKEMKSDIEQLPSQENDHKTALGQIINMLNPGMNSSIAQGFSGASNHLLGRAFSSWFGWKTERYYDTKVLTKYDEHKIYTPRNTIQSMHKYEGNLEFKHEFTLVFSYKLRSYQNINPKSAMLDLLANIFATTYTRGSFWGGRQEIIGAQPNKSGWNKANQLINKTEDIIGGIFSAMQSGTFDMGSFIGSLSNGLKNFVGILGDNLEGFKKDTKGAIIEMLKGSKALDAAKGLLRNQLGRPEIYAFQSLLDGSNTGLWHVTIGNPLNPIASIGNLIITNTSVQHLGPLGIDDFPTELKVTVTLKHARPRDAVAMERMYTKGVGAIYMPLTAYKERTKVFREDVKEEIGSLDYFGEFDAERIKRNADELA